MNKLLFAFFLVFLVFVSSMVSAQGSRERSLTMVPQNEKYLYQIGESALLNIAVLNPGHVKDPIKIHYSFSLDGIHTLEGPKTIENFYTTGHGSPDNWRTQT